MKKGGFTLICIILSLYLVLFSFYKINLPTADIGRHIANGKIFLNSSEYGLSKSDILYTNLFSYTYTNFPFINHHWFSGILTYLLFSLFGFKGLSIIYFLLILGAFIFSLATSKEDDLTQVFLIGLFLTPLIADRTEVRPEGISYLFLAIFIFILYRFSKDKLPSKYLWFIPALELIWANSHIYFIFGIFLVGVFWFESLVRKNFEKTKKLSIVLISTIVASIITPYGIKGLLYPFFIFQNYGYRIVENQSIKFLENLSFANPSFLWYKITLILVIGSCIFVLLKNKREFPIALSIISLTFAILGYTGVRHITAFTILSLPLLIYNFSIIKNYFSKKRGENEEFKMVFYGFSFFIIIFISMWHFGNRLPWSRDFGLGIKESDLKSTEFILKNNIKGPVFNNYDIGGMMIFSLFPKEKVFVDNRPEAYPKEFFEKVYIPMQENEEIWNVELEKEKFNVIYFYRLDYTPWSQKFLISRVQDPAWAPVFVDDKTIIFLRRNEENKEIIEKYELPKEMFNF